MKCYCLKYYNILLFENEIFEESPNDNNIKKSVLRLVKTLENENVLENKRVACRLPLIVIENLSNLLDGFSVLAL